jgi:hypothetical protein
VDRAQLNETPELPDSGPSFVESPMTRIWGAADSSRGVDVAAVARLQEKLAAAADGSEHRRNGRRWLRARR